MRHLEISDCDNNRQRDSAKVVRPGGWLLGRRKEAEPGSTLGLVGHDHERWPRPEVLRTPSGKKTFSFFESARRFGTSVAGTPTEGTQTASPTIARKPRSAGPANGPAAGA